MQQTSAELGYYLLSYSISPSTSEILIINSYKYCNIARIKNTFRSIYILYIYMQYKMRK